MPFDEFHGAVPVTRVCRQDELDFMAALEANARQVDGYTTAMVKEVRIGFECGGIAVFDFDFGAVTIYPAGTAPFDLVDWVEEIGDVQGGKGG